MKNCEKTQEIQKNDKNSKTIIKIIPIFFPFSSKNSVISVTLIAEFTVIPAVVLKSQNNPLTNKNIQSS